MSASHLIHATVIFVIHSCQFSPNWIFGLKWKLWPFPTWLVLHQSKAVFLLTLYDIIDDMKHFRNVCIIPQLCHIYFCC